MAATAATRSTRSAIVTCSSHLKVISGHKDARIAPIVESLSVGHPVRRDGHWHGTVQEIHSAVTDRSRALGLPAGIKKATALAVASFSRLETDQKVTVTSLEHAVVLPVSQTS
jgi:hypothetical protein